MVDEKEILDILKRQLEIYRFKEKTYNIEIELIRFTNERFTLNDLDMNEEEFRKLIKWLEG